MAEEGAVVLAVDPGRRKCGVAVVNTARCVLARCIVEPTNLEPTLTELMRAHRVTHLVVGDRTGARGTSQVVLRVAGGRPVAWVDEHLSSFEARTRYFREHPPRGLRRWIPLGLQVPPRPVDDFVAVILAERYLASLTDASP